MDISKDVSMNYMFEDCSSLQSLPNILKWNISKVTDMVGMINGCLSLLTLPDISKLN